MRNNNRKISVSDFAKDVQSCSYDISKRASHSVSKKITTAITTATLMAVCMSASAAPNDVPNSKSSVFGKATQQIESQERTAANKLITWTKGEINWDALAAGNTSYIDSIVNHNPTQTNGLKQLDDPSELQRVIENKQSGIYANPFSPTKMLTLYFKQGEHQSERIFEQSQELGLSKDETNKQIQAIKEPRSNAVSWRYEEASSKYGNASFHSDYMNAHDLSNSDLNITFLDTKGAFADSAFESTDQRNMFLLYHEAVHATPESKMMTLESLARLVNKHGSLEKAANNAEPKDSAIEVMKGEFVADYMAATKTLEHMLKDGATEQQMHNLLDGLIEHRGFSPDAEHSTYPALQVLKGVIQENPNYPADVSMDNLWEHAKQTATSLAPLGYDVHGPKEYSNDNSAIGSLGLEVRRMKDDIANDVSVAEHRTHYHSAP